MWVFVQISLKFVLKGPINNDSTIVQISLGAEKAKRISKRMEDYLYMTHVCATWPIECVSVKSILSMIFYALSEAVRFQHTHFSCHVMIVRIYVFHLIIIVKSKVWTINCYLWLGMATMISAVYVAMFSCSFKSTCFSLSSSLAHLLGNTWCIPL